MKEQVVEKNGELYDLEMSDDDLEEDNHDSFETRELLKDMK